MTILDCTFTTEDGTTTTLQSGDKISYEERTRTLSFIRDGKNLNFNGDDKVFLVSRTGGEDIHKFFSLMAGALGLRLEIVKDKGRIIFTLT